MQIRAHAEKRLETGMFGSGKQTKADDPSKLRHRGQCKHFIVTYAARQPLFWAAVCSSLARNWPGMRIVLPAEAPAITVAIAHGLRVSREAFLDRAYDDNGRLVPRSEPGSVLTDAREVAQRAVQLVTEGRLLSRGGRDLPLVSDTLCLHGDRADAAAFARALRQALEADGVHIRPLARPAGAAA